MSAGIPDRAVRWRELAAEARASAEPLNDPQARLIMLTIADAYDRLAKRAENSKTTGHKSSKD